jgi:hypothetical protein
LVEASKRPTEKRKDTNMQNMNKTLRAVGEAGFTRMIEKYAKTVHPTLTKEQAFTKVFLADDDEGRAIRHAWQIAKQSIAADEPSDDDALDELETLAAEERRRNPKLSKARVSRPSIVQVLRLGCGAHNSCIVKCRLGLYFLSF